jgi:hypothetical protein
MKTAWAKETAMIPTSHNTAHWMANFAVRALLLVVLFPADGKMPDMPAGIRTAIEMIGKRETGAATDSTGMTAASQPALI